MASLASALSKRAVTLTACASTGLSFLLALLAFSQLLKTPVEEVHQLSFNYFRWIQAGAFIANFGFMFDQLTGVMILVVTGIGFLIHIYSAGYMAHEEGYYRFFTYLNLFMFSMLVLILANNFLLMFVGWEGVGLCSYLLIGFYFRKQSAADAGKKAFIVNRVGDFGFTLAVMLIFWTFGSIDFQTVFTQAKTYSLEPLGTLGVLTVVVHSAFHWSDREIGAGAALRLAARRHGRPDAGQRADPCCHDGDRRRLHGGPL